MEKKPTSQIVIVFIWVFIALGIISILGLLTTREESSYKSTILFDFLNSPDMRKFAILFGQFVGTNIFAGPALYGGIRLRHDKANYGPVILLISSILFIITNLIIFF